MTGNKREPKYMNYPKEIEGKKFYRLWGFGQRPIMWVYLGVIALIFAVLRILYGGFNWDWVSVAFAFTLAITGIGFFIQASWCLRKSWELEERARRERSRRDREEIEIAARVCKEYVDVCRGLRHAAGPISCAILALSQLLTL